MAACWCASPARAWPPPTDHAAAGDAAPRRAHARRGAVLGEAADARRASRRAVPSPAWPCRTTTVTRQVLAEPDGDLPGKTWAHARRRHAAGDRRQARQGTDRAVPRHRRHDLVEPAALGRLRRDAAPDRRRCRGTAVQPQAARRCNAGAGAGLAEPDARRDGRLRGAAGDRPAGARRRARASGGPTIRRASTVRRRGSSPSTRWHRTRR